MQFCNFSLADRPCHINVRETRHIMRATLLILMLSILASAHADDDVAAIEAAYATWRTAVEASDIAGYVSVLHPEVRLLPPGAEAINGADNYAKFLGPVFETATYEIEPHRYPEVIVQGDTAVAEYDYTIHLTLKNPDVEVTEPGALTASATTARYFDVLLKTDGEWRVWRHSWQVYERPAE